MNATGVLVLVLFIGIWHTRDVAVYCVISVALIRFGPYGILYISITTPVASALKNHYTDIELSRSSSGYLNYFWTQVSRSRWRIHF
jgi:hypothetical protein